MSQPPEHIEPTGSIAPVVTDGSGTLIDASMVPTQILEALQRTPRPEPASGNVPPVWTTETMQAIKRIHEIVSSRCPEWAWASWGFTPSSAQVNVALIDAGYKAYDTVGNDIVRDPGGTGAAQIQTVNWDAHYYGEMEDPTKARVVSDGRPENGGIFPIVTVGPPDAEKYGEDIARMLESWTKRYATLVELPPTAAVPEARKPSNGSMPVSGVMAWACDLCQTVVRQGTDGTMPTFVCPGCGATQRWRQPTMDELANVSPRERAAVDQSRGHVPVAMVPGFVAPGMATRQGDNDFFAAQGLVQGQGGAPLAYPASQAQNQMATVPDPETRAIADICWLLDGLQPEQRMRVVRYVRDRWS